MDWALLVMLLVMIEPSLSVLFTVQAERTMYVSEFGGDVVMGCRFQPKLSNPNANLKVIWHWLTATSVRDVYGMDNGEEHLASQDPDYRGRVRLLTEELKEGWAKIQVSKLRINDSGTYQCLLQTEEGADYKTIALSVTAPYKEVTKHIEKAEGDEVLLTCQSEGFPESPVEWQDGQLQRLTSNTTAVSTPDQLVKVTSRIHVRSSDKNNYTCVFTNGGYSATFHIPDELPQVKNDALIVILSVGLIMVVIIIAVLMYRRQKGSSNPSTRNGGGMSFSAASCLQIDKDNEEKKTIINEGSMEESLGAFVKARYSDFSFVAEVRRRSEALGVEELPHRLQNNAGQPANLQALLPEAGQTLLLEGAPGSGKTTVAQILVSSWTEGPTHPFSNLLNLSAVRLLLYVDCSKAKGDLFQEITTQLSLTEKISTEDELRAELTRSSEVLLLLDEYKEGNQRFDESFRRFLSERGGCRVLVTSCPGHCPTLKDIVGTGGLIELQTQTVKY